MFKVIVCFTAYICILTCDRVHGGELVVSDCTLYTTATALEIISRDLEVMNVFYCCCWRPVGRD